MIDICLPEGNEIELLRRAKELGYSNLIFLYPFKSKADLVKKKKELQDLKVFFGIYLKPNKPQIRISNQLYLEADLIAVSSQDEKIIRAAVSNPKIDLIFRVPSSAGRDHPAYRRSNFNEILANLAKQNKVRYAIDFSALLEHEGIARAKLLGREAQNVRLCRRKIPIIIASFAKDVWQLRNPHDLSAIAQLLGLNAPQAKAAVSSAILKIIKCKQKRRLKGFIAPGIRVVEH